MNTRDKIINIADKFFYEKGFENTSFADIAANLNISRGNFYHHFKTKDEILDEVIKQRLKNTQNMVDNWDLENENPAARLKTFVKILIRNQSKIMEFGCPVGTLCTELSKLNHKAQNDANELFILFQTWMVRQFNQIEIYENANKHAMHLLMRTQGMAVIANAFRDENFVQTEVDNACSWIDEIIEKEGKNVRNLS
ncbi:MAG: TetR/AcrR family transcriptional regulator [Caulobacterales bacterium]|nr:TetR/AcrR family transcriptional regulator [Caulobacterales bacterium]MCA0371283.1 TetR/AcrR family transcriptional regulator [Pseudomonadota bacterium]